MVVPFVLSTLLVLVACVKGGIAPLPTVTGTQTLPSQVRATPVPSETRIAPLTDEALKNAVYQGIYQEAVQLTNGTYTGAPSEEGSASRPTVTFTGPTTFGDLNGDGVDDAAAILVESSGGSGSFVYLAAVLNQKGKPDNVATQLLGDRVQVESVTIVDGLIILFGQLIFVALVCLVGGIVNSLITWVVEERLYRKYKRGR